MRDPDELLTDLDEGAVQIAFAYLCSCKVHLLPSAEMARTVASSGWSVEMHAAWSRRDIAEFNWIAGQAVTTRAGYDAIRELAKMHMEPAGIVHRRDDGTPCLAPLPTQDLPYEIAKFLLRDRPPAPRGAPRAYIGRNVSIAMAVVRVLVYGRDRQHTYKLNRNGATDRHSACSIVQIAWKRLFGNIDGVSEEQLRTICKERGPKFFDIDQIPP